MNEKVTIENIQKQNSDYNNAVQARNQYESLLLLSRDVFTEYIRFLFELIQNADDAKATEINIVVLANYLVISHDGEAFSKEDVEGICNVGSGTKKSKSNTTGYKGVGFKSVFGKSTCVSIFSNGFQFKFDEVFPQAKYPVMPWQIIPQWTDLPKQISEALKGKVWNVSTVIRLDITKDLIADLKELLNTSQILLFLRSVQKISARGQVEVSIEKKTISLGQVELTKNNSEKTNWIVRNIQDKVDKNIKEKIAPDQNIPDKIKFATTFDISFAAKVEKGKIVALNERESLIFTYLPTKVKNFGFPFLLNSNFLADTSREKLHEDNAWNQWLMEIAGKKIVDWLAELANTDYALQILHLLPEQSKSTTNRLTSNFFDSFHSYCQEKPFVPNRRNELKIPSDIVIDETGLSNETGFIAPKVLIDFINKGREESKFKSDAFVNPKLQLAVEKLPTLGSVKFDLNNLEDFFTDDIFQESQDVSQNFSLIKYFFKKAGNKAEWNFKLKSIPFVWAKRVGLKAPLQLMFPTPEGVELKDADEVKSSIPEIHKDVYAQIENHTEIKLWLANLGVKESEQILDAIVDNASSIITASNYLKITRYLFNSYKQGLLEGTFYKLSKLNLYTTKKEFRQANECYLSDIFEPNLKLEKINKLGNYVSNKYKDDSDLPSEWKAFFIKIGVAENISIQHIETSRHSSNQKIPDTYFVEVGASAHQQATNANYHPHLVHDTNPIEIDKISFTEFASEYEFSKLYWNQVLQNISPESIPENAKLHWGYYGSKWSVENYIQWSLKNQNLFPTTTRVCLSANEVFINEREIVKIAGKYLPVLDCETVVSEDWLKLIPLKEKLLIEDYLSILSGISEEIEKENSVTEISKERIAIVYERLNSKLTNKSIEVISDWSNKNKLLSNKNKMNSPHDLFWLKEQTDSLVNDDLDTIYFPADLLNETDTEKLLNAFSVIIISDFKLLTEKPSANDSLQNELLAISPYLSAIIEKKDGVDFETSFVKLKNEIKKLKVVNSANLELAYIHNEQQRVISKLDSYFDENSNTLYFKGQWESPTTMYSLVEHISKALHIEKHKEELRLFLQLESSAITDWLKSKFDIVKSDVEIKPTVSKFIAELIPATEEEIKVSDSGILTDNSSIKTRISINEEAQEIVFSTLERNNFKVDKRQKITFTILEGVESPNGKLIKVVVKSAKAGRIYFTPLEWLALAEEDSQLFVLTAGNRVRNVTLSDLQKINDEFHMRFNTGMFVLSNLKVLANFFKGLPYTHFIFNAPESTTDYLQEFGLNQRNPTASDLSADDKNLLH